MMSDVGAARRVRGHELRRELEAVAIKLWHQYGYHETRVEDITSMVSVTKPTFYYYFDSKEALLAEILFESLQRVQDALEEVTQVEVGPAEELSLFDQSVLL